MWKETREGNKNTNNEGKEDMGEMVMGNVGERFMLIGRSESGREIGEGAVN